MGEIDKYKNDLLYITETFQSARQRNEIKNKEDQKKISDLEAMMKEKNDEINKLKHELERTIRSTKLLQDENLKLRQRIQRIKNKRFRIEDNQKICKKCTREYLEKENFNWSCKTHQSEWSNDAQMWWCCGKTTKEADGCKIGKHESKDDDEDEAADPKEEQQKHLKNVRCHCCKEVGHTIDTCPRDPNIKTNREPMDELVRIKQIKDYRKLFGDTMILTTHFLKKCIKVPKIKKPQLEMLNGQNTTLLSN